MAITTFGLALVVFGLASLLFHKRLARTTSKLYCNVLQHRLAERIEQIGFLASGFILIAAGLVLFVFSSQIYRL